IRYRDPCGSAGCRYLDINDQRIIRPDGGSRARDRRIAAAAREQRGRDGQFLYHAHTSPRFFVSRAESTMELVCRSGGRDSIHQESFAGVTLSSRPSRADAGRSIAVRTCLCALARFEHESSARKERTLETLPTQLRLARTSANWCR